jgi:hypothetical protein
MAKRYVTDPLYPTSRKQRLREIRGAVQAQTAPLIADITRRINASAANASRNIAGTSSALAESLRPLEGQIGGIYDRGISDLGGLDSRLNDRLAALGKEMGIGDVGAGAAAASQGSGNAELAQMLAQKASGQSYAAKLPGLAQLQGAQNIGIMQAGKQKELADQIGGIRSQVPGLVQNLLSESEQREMQKSIALRGYGMDQAELISEARRYAAAEATRRAALSEKRRHDRATEREAAAKRADAAAQKQHDRDLEREKEKNKARESAKDRRQKARIEGRKERGRNSRNKSKNKGKNRKLPGSGN